MKRAAPPALVALAGAALALAAPPAAAAPGVTVLPATTGLDPAGQTLTVRGSGFDPNANGRVGIYVVFGPKGADYSTNADRYQAAKWVRSSALGGSGQSELRADGTFEVTLPGLKAKYLDGNDELVDCYVVECLVMTFTAHGVPDRSHDTFTPVAFATGKPAPVGRARVPYRPKPSASRSAGAPAAAPRAKPRASATAVPSPTALPARSSAPAATRSGPDSPTAAPEAGAVAAPVPVEPPPSASAAAAAGAVAVGAVFGAGSAYVLRRRARVGAR